MKSVRVVFHLGLAVALTMLLVATWGLAFHRQPLTVEVLLAYVMAGLVHVLVLGLLGRQLPPASRPTVSNWLYTAGFIHTLIALGTAIASVGSTIPGSGALTLATLAPILAPMGAAVVPHALGVWIGHSFESQRTDPRATFEESVLKKLADDAEDTRAILKEVYATRERLLKAELVSLQKQAELWRNANTDLSTLLQEARGAIGVTLTEARTHLQQVGVAARDLAGDLKEPLRRVTDVLGRLAEESDKASGATTKVRQALEKSASDAVALRGALQDTVGVIGDLKKVQASIVELLEAELFKRER